MFDGVHTGHRHLLDMLRAEALRRDLIPTVFTFPSHPLATVNPAKAPLLLSEPAEKLHLLTTCGLGIRQINFMVFDRQLRQLPAAEFMEILHEQYCVDFILRGFNNRFGTERHLSPDDYRLIATQHGIELTDASCLSATVNDKQIAVSSSAIRLALAQGDVGPANMMLGYHYSLTGTVIGGKRLGRTLGFPTANLSPLHRTKLIPGPGVYICQVSAAGKDYRAMVNIGTRPTVDGISSTKLSIEAHILDFDGDLYGEQITLCFLKRLRAEMRFDSTDALSRQLEADRLETQNFNYGSPLGKSSANI